MQYLLAPLVQCVDYNGHPLTSGYIEVYIHGTSIPYITKANWDGKDNPFKVPLDEKGICTLIATSENAYDLYCYDAHGVLQWSRMNVNTCGYASGTTQIPLPTVSADDTFTVVATTQRADRGTNYGISLSTEFLGKIDDLESATAENAGAISHLNYQVDSVINDLNKLNRIKQNKLTAGDGISIANDVISVTGGGSGGNGKVSVDGTDAADYLANKLVAAPNSSLSLTKNGNGQLVADVMESVIDNPLLVTTFLMNENGNCGFTGGNWGGTGEWNTYGINTTTRYYRVTTLGRGTVSKVKVWNYNGSGRVRICLMTIDGTLKAQSEWHAVSATGPIELDMVAESGQDATIERNTDYWIGVCGYGVQLVSYNKAATSFNENSLRYAICIRNGGAFPCSGTGWDNPNTDEVNSIAIGIPIVYMLAPENKEGV